MDYTGTVVEESLIDNRLLNQLRITHFRISGADNPRDRWHLYTVRVNEKEIDRLSQQLKPEKWYMHFWRGDDVIAIFPGRTFCFKHSDKKAWQPAIEYGLRLGIPEEQLDFVITTPH